MSGETLIPDVDASHEIDDKEHAIYGFTVSLHPDEHIMPPTGQQIVLSLDRLLGEFDEFCTAFQDNPHIIEDDAFAEALIDYIAAGIQTDIYLLRKHNDSVEPDTEPVADAFETALDELKTELSVWIAEYRRYVRLEHPKSGIRDDSMVHDFIQSQPYDFYGISDTHDIIRDTIEPYLPEETNSA